LLCGVGEVDGCTVISQNLALRIVCDVNVANILAPSVGSNNENLVTILVLFDCRVFTLCVRHVSKQGVGMAAHDQLEPGSGFSELLVFFVTDMSDCRNPCDVGGRPDLIDGILHSLHDVREDCAVIRVRDAWGLFRSYTDKRQALLLEDVVRLHPVRDLLVGRLQVRADDGEGQVVQEVTQHLFAAIKLVVSKRHRIELKLVERLGNLLSTVERVEECALELVANIQPEAVVVLGTLLLDDCLDAGVATVAATLGSRAVSA